jgi:transposase
MTLPVETLFTAALGLQTPWVVREVELNTVKRRIDFEVTCDAKRLACPACGAAEQGIHDRVRRDWRHLDFFQFEAWLHADVPRVKCDACGKTSQVAVPWAREGSGFTLLFEAMALSLCRELPVAQAANLLRGAGKRLWTRIDHYIKAARSRDDMGSVRQIGVDETSVKKGHEYITVVHDLDAKRLLFACPGRDHETVATFAQDLTAHGGNPEAVAHVCMDMSAAYQAAEILPAGRPPPPGPQKLKCHQFIDPAIAPFSCADPTPSPRACSPCASWRTSCQPTIPCSPSGRWSTPP